MSKSAVEVPPKCGFNFDLCKRNDMLSKKGVKPPSYRKTGTTIVGLVFQDGVILGADTRATEGPIVCDKNCEKIHYMAPNIYCCGAGTAADTEAVTDMVSSQLQLHRYHTGRESRVITALILLKKHLFNYQGYVQAALVLGGVDCTGPHLHTIYPHGSTDTLPFATMGSGSLAAMAIFESKYKEGLTRDEGIKLVTEAICSAVFNDLGSGSNVDVCVITKGHKEYLRNHLLPNPRTYINPRGYAFPKKTALEPDLDKPDDPSHEFAQFGAGCFWGVELAFQRLVGVVKTEVGYSQGHVPDPNYELVCTKTTNHVEVVRVQYDPEVCPYTNLLSLFWSRHNPTTLNRQIRPRLPFAFRLLRPVRRLSLCASSSETLVANSKEDGNRGLASKKGKSPAPAAAAAAAEDSPDLKSWMHSNGLPPCKVVLKERASHDSKHQPIHYVAASEDLQAGDVAFSVPNSLVVTLERVLGNETIAELLTTNKLSELACLALYLMYEKKQGKKSFWYPYIRELDRQRGRGQLAVESPLLWSEAELAYLTGSPTKAEVIERAEGIKREYNELDTVWFMAGSLFQQYPYDIPTEAFPFEIFKQAFVAVQSCVVHLQKVSLARRFALVPLGPPLLAYRSNCKAMLSVVDGAVELVVDRSYKAGEPIVVWCGPQPNAKLLLNYGFVDEDNTYDRILIEAALNTEDPQYQDKRMVAQKNRKLSVQVFQVNVGKEKEAVLDMLPYLRLGYVSDPSEMQSVISSQGPICPVSPCMERAVLDQLADYFKSRLAGYPTTLSEDESMLSDPNLNPKKRVATQLIRLEKKMLNACLEVTVGLINQLPDHAVSPCPAPYAPLLR